jgi:hypothetical protein
MVSKERKMQLMDVYGMVDIIMRMCWKKGSEMNSLPGISVKHMIDIQINIGL